MSKDLALSDMKPPALKGAAAKALQAKAGDIANRIGTESSNMKIKGKKGKIIVGDDSYNEIQLVVIDFIAKRTFYESPYRDGEAYRPPTCYGISQGIDSMTPHVNVEEIGGEFQGTDCRSCALNQWKSDPMGGNGKACKERRVMLVLPPGADHVNDDFWELDISPTSLKSFDKFVRDINDNWHIPPIGAVVTLRLDPDVDFVKYEFTNPVSNDQINEHFERMEKATEILKAMEYSVAEDEAPKPKRRPAKKKTAKKKAARRAK